jgi:hypothetical protein
MTATKQLEITQSEDTMKQTDDRSRRRFLKAGSLLGLAAARSASGHVTAVDRHAGTGDKAGFRPDQISCDSGSWAGRHPSLGG